MGKEDRYTLIICGVHLRKKYTIITLSIVVIILFILSGFITTRHTVKFPCRFVSQAEWSVHVDDPEKVYVEFKRNDKKTLERFDCYHFSRPDLIRFEVEPNIAVGRYLDAGQIVANIHSQEDAYCFESLKAEIETVQAELELLSTGEKKEVREEAKQALLYAQAQLEAH